MNVKEIESVGQGEVLYTELVENASTVALEAWSTDLVECYRRSDDIYKDVKPSKTALTGISEPYAVVRFSGTNIVKLVPVLDLYKDPYPALCDCIMESNWAATDPRAKHLLDVVDSVNKGALKCYFHV